MQIWYKNKTVLHTCVWALGTNLYIFWSCPFTFLSDLTEREINTQNYFLFCPKQSKPSLFTFFNSQES